RVIENPRRTDIRIFTLKWFRRGFPINANDFSHITPFENASRHLARMWPRSRPKPGGRLFGREFFRAHKDLNAAIATFWLRRLSEAKLSCFNPSKRQKQESSYSARPPQASNQSPSRQFPTVRLRESLRLVFRSSASSEA